MQKDLYACSEFIQNVCIKWEKIPKNNVSLIDILAITKADAILIGSALGSCFGLIIAFLIVAKALKSM